MNIKIDINKKAKSILIIGFLISILVRIYLILNSLDVADISMMHKVADLLSQGKNPYLEAKIYVYPPLGAFLQYISHKLADFFGVSFNQIIRIWPNLADLVIACLIYKFLIKKKVRSVKASLWTVFYLLNPISLMISSSHGQIDSIPTLLVLFAIYITQFGKAKLKLYLGSLLIGLAFSIKPNPILLLPFFIFSSKFDLGRSLKYLTVAFIPLALSLIPFLANSFFAVIKSLVSYSGAYDFGYAAILRSVWYQHNANYWLPFDIRFAQISKITYLLGYLFIFLAYHKSKNLTRSCIMVFLLFYIFYFGVSAQYFIWILPLAIIERDKRVFPYTILGSLALVGFYLFFSPKILLGSLISFKAFQSEMISLYFFGNLFLWSLVLYWFLYLLVDYFKEGYPKLSFVYRRVILIVLLFFSISIIPTLNLWFKIQGR
jgi:hypothetical protein